MMYTEKLRFFTVIDKIQPINIFVMINAIIFKIRIRINLFKQQDIAENNINSVTKGKNSILIQPKPEVASPPALTAKIVVDNRGISTNCRLLAFLLLFPLFC
jgi:hypothetical protein